MHVYCVPGKVDEVDGDLLARSLPLSLKGTSGEKGRLCVVGTLHGHGDSFTAEGKSEGGLVASVRLLTSPTAPGLR